MRGPETLPKCTTAVPLTVPRVLQAPGWQRGCGTAGAAYLQEVYEVTQHQSVELRQKLHYGHGSVGVLIVADTLFVELLGDHGLLQLPIPELKQRGWAESRVRENISGYLPTTFRGRLGSETQCLRKQGAEEGFCTCAVSSCFSLGSEILRQPNWPVRGKGWLLSTCSSRKRLWGRLKERTMRPWS